MNEHFSMGSSYFHTLDPRAKIIGAFGLTLYLALTDHYGVAGSGLCIGILFLFISRIQLWPVCKRLAAVNSFTLFLWLTLPLTYGGPSLFNMGPVPISAEGVRLALLISLKTNGIVLITLSLLATSTIGALGHGLNRMRLPTKLSYLLLYSYRYIFVVHQEYRRLLRAARMRNFISKISIHTYRTYGYLFGMTVIKSWNRSKHVNQAMMLRGFNGRLIPLDQPQLRINDTLFLSVIFIILLGLFMMDRLCAF